ncbi:hypothetical protein [Enterococcus sp. AZ192]|uniref:hypothetical protein n=1 Tax=unclassified Enterococcus TaxID=2608891 RepID=UPI003D2C7471
MKTEYLIQIKKNESIATTENSLKYLLMSNKEINITNDKIEFKDQSFFYSIQKNIDSNNQYIYYHLTIKSSENSLDLNSGILVTYLTLLKYIRKIMFKHSERIEVLWDEVGFYCSQNAYVLIYEIENLMRKLFTKFMHVNVGASWEIESAPKNLNDKGENQTNRKNQFGNSLLYRVDFKDLSSFLFKPYAKNENYQDIGKNIREGESISYDSIKDYIKKSNWERYFKEIVDMESESLMKKLESLYELRCKVAHNNILTIENLKTIEKLTSELKETFSKVIEKLDTVEITDENKDVISENILRTNNEVVGDFLRNYNELMSNIDFLLLDKETDKKIKKVINFTRLRNELNIPKRIVNDLEDIRNFRNTLVHSMPAESDVNKIEEYLRKIWDVEIFFEGVPTEPQISILKLPVVSCKQCNNDCLIEEIELELVFSEEERGMGDENHYLGEYFGNCSICKNEIIVKIESVEYPSMFISYNDTTAEGAVVIEKAKIDFI